MEEQDQEKKYEAWLRYQQFGNMTDEEIEAETGMDWDSWYIVYSLDECWRED